MKNEQTHFSLIIYIYVYHWKRHGWSARGWLTNVIRRVPRVV